MCRGRHAVPRHAGSPTAKSDWPPVALALKCRNLTLNEKEYFPSYKIARKLSLSKAKTCVFKLKSVLNVRGLVVYGTFSVPVLEHQ